MVDNKSLEFYKESGVFNDAQIRQIEIGIEHYIKVDAYALPLYTADQMVQIRLGLEMGMKINSFNDPNMSADDMRKERNRLIEILKPVDLESISPEDAFDNTYYNSINDYRVIGLFNNQQLFEIRDGLDSNLDVRPYAKPYFNCNQMNELRRALKAGHDITQYATEDFSADQMKQIRLGQNQGLDVSVYMTHLLSPEQMGQVRIALEDGKKNGIVINGVNLIDQLKEKIRLILEECIDTLTVKPEDLRQ